MLSFGFPQTQQEHELLLVQESFYGLLHHREDESLFFHEKLEDIISVVL